MIAPQLTNNPNVDRMICKQFYEGKYGMDTPATKNNGEWGNPRKRLKQSEDGSFVYKKAFVTEMSEGRVPFVPLEVTILEASLAEADSFEAFDATMTKIIWVWLEYIMASAKPESWKPGLENIS